ncbi:hypothetical protein [Micromonospora sp. NPDC048842]|uniref:hypothetical protein n=1 Tax=unclassified Micromonospora TaxID=2617518 RepID=UPI0033E6DB15
MGYSGCLLPGGCGDRQARAVLVADLATFAVPPGAWSRREPVLHNVLLTLVADRLSGNVPLSG